jgi:hypothetical protein
MNELEAMVHKISCLFHSKVNTILLYFLVVSFDWFKIVENFLRHYGLCELQHPIETIITKDWHDSWNN